MAKKTRPQVPDDLAAIVIFEADHTCCKCNERGRPIQLHHIDSDPSNNVKTNLALLCVLCHDETLISGGFGRKLNVHLVIEYRDDWIRRVAERRRNADDLAVARMSRTPGSGRHGSGPSGDALVCYVNELPDIIEKSYQKARSGWASGITSEMVQSTWNVLDVVVQILGNLAEWFPQKHFDGKSPAEFFSAYVSARATWHRALAEPGGVGTGGTIVSTTTAGATLKDAEEAVEDMVDALMFQRRDFNLKRWKGNWQNSR